MRATPKPGGIACCSAQVRGPRIRRLRVACSAPPDSPYQSLERAVQVGGIQGFFPIPIV